MRLKMNRCMIMLMLLATCAAPAHGQTVFFDDFEGDALLPHWSQPPPEYWDYNISDSMLNVTGLFVPSHPKSPTNFVTLGAFGAFAPITDFILDARIGWDTGDTIARFNLTIMINQSLVATLGYRPNPVSGPSGIIASTDAGVIAIPAPTSGMHDFQMTRTGSVFNFSFDGSHFASLPSAYSGPVDGVQFFLSSPFPGESGPYHIDWVHVQAIPTPGTLCVLVAGVAWFSRHTRTRFVQLSRCRDFYSSNK